MGYTLNGASDSIVDLDSNALAVSVQGALSAASQTSGDGSGNRELWTHRRVTWRRYRDD